MKIQRSINAVLLGMMVAVSACAAEIGGEGEYASVGGIASCPNCVSNGSVVAPAPDEPPRPGREQGSGATPGGDQGGAGAGDGSGGDDGTPRTQVDTCLLVCGFQANNCSALAGWLEPTYAPDVTAITTCLAQGNCLNAYACRR